MSRMRGRHKSRLARRVAANVTEAQLAELRQEALDLGYRPGASVDEQRRYIALLKTMDRHGVTMTEAHEMVTAS